MIIKVDGYRRNGGFKISFEVEYEYKKGDDDRNLDKAIKEAKRKTKQLNKLYGFHGKEKMISITVMDKVVRVY